jgi:hypothetical protein
VRRADTDVQCNVQGFAFDDATEFGLCVLQLIMKAAKRSSRRVRVIVLEEGVFDAEVEEFGVMVRLEERAA